MTKLDFYWQSNQEWYHWEKMQPVLNDDAPDEAKESYKHYQEQLKEKENRI